MSNMAFPLLGTMGAQTAPTSGASTGPRSALRPSPPPWTQTALLRDVTTHTPRRARTFLVNGIYSGKRFKPCRRLEVHVLPTGPARPPPGHDHATEPARTSTGAMTKVSSAAPVGY